MNALLAWPWYLAARMLTAPLEIHDAIYGKPPLRAIPASDLPLDYRNPTKGNRPQL